MTRVTGHEKVLVITAHPDDAEIVMGGTIAGLVDKGCEVTILNMTVSEATAELRARRCEAAEKAASVLGCRLDWFEEGRLDHAEDVPEYRLVAQIDRYITDYRPDAVFSHWIGDSHSDHARLARCVNASSRRWQAPLFALPPSEHRTPSFAAFTPNVYVDISNHLERKIRAASHYTYPGQSFRPLDLEGLASIARGWGATAGYAAAETFLLTRSFGLPLPAAR